MYSKIIISGKRCSGKTTLFWTLQKSLNWPTFSVGQFLRDYIRIHHVSPMEVEEQSREVSNDIDTRIHTLLISPHNVIIDARVFGNIHQPYPDTLRVLLTANDQKRVERAALREQTPIEKQQNKFLKKEEDWLLRMSNMYGKDLFDPHHYDLVIDTTNMSEGDIVNTVISKLQLTS